MDFLAVFGTIIFALILIGILAQVPLEVWAIVVPVLIIIGLFNKNAK